MNIKRYSPEQFASLVQDPKAEVGKALVERAFDEAARVFPGNDTKAYTKALTLGERDLVFRMSDKSIDRHNDTIEPHGWSWDSFLKSGSMILFHDAHQFPIARPVELWVEREALFGQFRFPEKGKHAVADLAFDLFSDGTLRGVSVGFLPKRWEYVTSRQENGKPGVDYKEQELLELSATPMPANANAHVIKAINAAKAFESIKEMLAKNEGQDALAPIKAQLDRIEQALGALAGIELVKQAVAVDTLIQAKEGRVLSKANQDKLSRASELVLEVLESARKAEAEEDKSATATHRCKVCKALWRENPPSDIQPDGSWSLVSAKAGECCDNVAMGEQIEELPKTTEPPTQEPSTKMTDEELAAVGFMSLVHGT